jgi:uncharacterized protein
MNIQESIRRILREEVTEDKNLYGEKLRVCSTKPMTGFYRDGYCKTGDDDTGSHTVCARVTEEFLEFTKSMGNNLDMLEPGDKWCLCAKRWEEANKEGVAPEMIKSSTNIKTLDIIDSDEQELDEYARTLKNARRQGVGLRFPKSAVKANPQRFRKYTRDNINESDESKQERKFTKLLNNIEEYINSNSYNSVIRVMVDYDEVMDDVIVNIFFDAEHAVKLGGGINSVIKKSGKKIMEDLSVFPFDFKYHIHFEKPQLNESLIKENKDQTKLIKGIIDSSDIFDYKHFCGFDIITPEERSDQYNFLNKNKIPYLIKVYFVGGPNSEVWPRTQAIRNKELDLMEELHEYIKSFVPFNIEMMGSHVNSCDGYKKLMKRKYTTDDLQESIRRILREEDRYDDKVGKTFWFEYHCYESPESCDAEIWYRSHQKVKVIGVSEWSYDDKEWRQEDGNPRVYLVEWEDGFQYDVFEDELMESPNEFYRPSPPKRKIQESIRRILREEDYSPAGKEIIPNSIIVHKSNPMFRDKIMEQGLKVRAGECYKIFVGYGVKCKPAIFATNSTNKRAWFDSTYDDDIWFIDTRMIPDVKWYKDRHFESTKKHIVTFQDIPKEAIILKYEGTGSGDVEKWDKDSPNIVRESIKKVLKEETEGIDSFLDEISSKHNMSDELKDFVKQFIEESDCKRINFSRFKMGVMGLALESGVLINSVALNHPLPFLLFLIFHEVAHQYQFKKYGEDVMYDCYLGEISEREAAEFMKHTEEVADDFAFRKIRQLQKLNLIGPYTPPQMYKNVPIQQITMMINNYREDMRRKNIDSPKKVSEYFYNMVKSEL